MMPTNLFRKPSPPASSRGQAGAPQRKHPVLSRPRPLDTSWKQRVLPGGLKILLVEDDQNLLSTLALMFRDLDCRVLCAPVGSVALQMAIQNEPSVVLSDYHLPGMTGFELIRRMRQEEALQLTPVIMLTGSQGPDKLADLVRCEAVAFLKKPATMEQVLEAAQRALGGRLPKKAPQPPLPPHPSLLDSRAVPSEPPQAPPELEPAPAPAAAPPVISLNAPAPAPAPAPELPMLPASSKSALDELLAHSSEAVKHLDQARPKDTDIYLAGNDDAPIIKLVNGVIMHAVEKKASDIHLEPQESHFQVRLRIDGEMIESMKIPAAMSSAIAARIKIMSSLDISERRVPQDGRFRMQLANGGKVEFRVSTLPCKYGEKVVMRVLGQSKIKGDLSFLKVPAREQEFLTSALASPNGIILVTGPTGSGKTTTLYTMIATLNKPNRNIVTAEDPVEYELPGISQVAINTDVGLTFEKALRSFLRQDPDVILVGEIRDLETATIAIKAAVTGHVVLSTLHTNDSVTTIARLTNMGVPAYMLAAALRVIVAQRLVRLLCVHCKAPAVLTDHEKQILSPAEAAELKQLYRSVGCPRCEGTGYSGRAPVIEILPIRTAEMRDLITKGASTGELQVQAAEEGLRTLRIAALEIVARGETSLPEAFKILVDK